MHFKKSLGSDNHSGIHPEFLKSIIDVNNSHAPSYGTDSVTKCALKLFKKNFGSQSESFFVFNGTAANVLCLKALIKSYQSVICTDISHLNLDECAAPEAIIGCKLEVIKSVDGKLTAPQIEEKLTRLGDQHHTQPGCVSITQPTEVGTVYSIEELQDIKKTCLKHSLKLHIDGARYILAAHYLNLTLLELTNIAQPDALSFGGTKNGLLFGEAVVFFNKDLAKDFKFLRKQAMQLPSKSRFLAAQFIKLFELWPEIAGHEHSMAKYLLQKLEPFKKIKIKHPVQANSVFPSVPRAWIKPLKNKCFFYVWDETNWTLRWMCSFDTTKQDIDFFIQAINELSDGSADGLNEL